MWNTTDDIRLKKLEKTIQCIYCSIRDGNNQPETDPIFTASPAFTITQAEIDSWNTTTIETDPIFTASPAFGITLANITTWNASETDPVFMASQARFITAPHITFLNSLNYNSLNNKPDLTLKADLVGGKVPASQLPDSDPQQIVTGVASYNLVPTAGLIHIFFTGTATILNLPPIATNGKLTILIFNGGTGDVTITANVADPNSVIDGNTGANTTTLTTKTPMTIFSINNKWVTKP